MRPLFYGTLISSALIACLGPANSQSMTPMRGEINSYSDEFALKVYPRNIYSHSINFEMRAYDQNFEPIDATIVPKSFALGGGDTRSVLVVVGFGNSSERKIRICAESIPYPNQQTLVKAQICGRFLARRSQ